MICLLFCLIVKREEKDKILVIYFINLYKNYILWLCEVFFDFFLNIF